MTENKTVKETTEKPPKWGQDRRLEFIDFRLQWEGKVNRSDLMEFFGISMPQASLDLSRYSEMAPTNIAYDYSQKFYQATDTFAPAVVSAASSRYLNQLLALDLGVLPKSASFLGWAPPIAAVHLPSRTVDMTTLKRALRAISQKQSLSIEYQSMGRPEPTAREISPHALAHDGFRWHLRAYCHLRNQFRDFVFARILKIGAERPSSILPETDEAWQRELNVIIAPNPSLPPGQRHVIELDYGMTNGQLILPVRQALLFYALRQLRLTEDTASPPQQQQIALLNREELEPYLRDSE